MLLAYEVLLAADTLKNVQMLFKAQMLNNYKLEGSDGCQWWKFKMSMFETAHKIKKGTQDMAWHMPWQDIPEQKI